MDYSEETSWTIRLEATAQFGDDYDGEDDGYVWREKFIREIQPQIAATVFRALSAVPGWKVRPGNRGLPTADELFIHLERDFSAKS